MDKTKQLKTMLRAGPVGVAAEQDAVAGEVRGDAAEAEARRGLLQPPLLVHPDCHAVAHDDGLHLLTADEPPQGVEAPVRVAGVRRDYLAFVRVDEDCLHACSLVSLVMTLPIISSAKRINPVVTALIVGYKCVLLV